MRIASSERASDRGRKSTGSCSAAIDRLADHLLTHGKAGTAPMSEGYLRLLLLDYLGVGLFGSRQEGLAEVAGTLAGMSGSEARSAFSGVGLSAPHAAFLNGYVVHGTDWDDSHLAAVVHPGVAVLSTALALAPQVQADLRRLIEAAVVGYDLAIWIGRAVQPTLMYQGFHGTSTCGVFGSAATASRLLGLTHRQTANALGLAASSASGTTQCILSGSSAKAFQAGKCAQDGIMAALLAKSGIDAPPESLDGARGFFQAYATGATPQTDFSDIGGRDQVLDVMVKHYPIAAHLHGAVEAAIALSAKLGGDLDEIESVQVTVDPAIARNNKNPKPANDQAARMSLPFCVACALALKGEEKGLYPEQLEAGLESPGIRALAARIDCQPWQGERSFSTGKSMLARVRITRDGAEHVAEAAPDWGAEGAGIPERIRSKFLTITKGMMTEELQDEIASLCLGSEGDLPVATLLEKVAEALRADLAGG